MDPSTSGHGPWNLSSLLDFSRPAHAAWSDVMRGAGITTLLGWIALTLNAPRALLPLTLGSVFTAIAETGQGREHPWRTMAWTTSWLTVAAGFGAAIGENTPLAVFASGAMGLICASAASRDKRTAVTSLLTLVVFTIYVGYPGPIVPAMQDMGLILLGGVIQTLVCSVVRAFQKVKHEPLFNAPIWRNLRSFRPSDAHVRHGIRLAITLMVATAISESTGLPHQYWLPMSVAWMSRAQLNSTCQRVLHRLFGTLLGLGFIALVVRWIGPHGAYWLPLSLLGAGILIAYVWVHYAAAVVGVTIWIIAAFALVGDPVIDTLRNRMLDTTIASAIVLMAVWIDLRASES